MIDNFRSRSLGLLARKSARLRHFWHLTWVCCWGNPNDGWGHPCVPGCMTSWSVDTLNLREDVPLTQHILNHEHRVLRREFCDLLLLWWLEKRMCFPGWRQEVFDDVWRREDICSNKSNATSALCTEQGTVTSCFLVKLLWTFRINVEMNGIQRWLETYGFNLLYVKQDCGLTNQSILMCPKKSFKMDS